MGQVRLDVVLRKFSSELRFKPEPSQTEPTLVLQVKKFPNWTQSSVHGSHEHEHVRTHLIHPFYDTVFLCSMSDIVCCLLQVVCSASAFDVCILLRQRRFASLSFQSIPFPALSSWQCLRLHHPVHVMQGVVNTTGHEIFRTFRNNKSKD